MYSRKESLYVCFKIDHVLVTLDGSQKRRRKVDSKNYILKVDRRMRL
jgi:hypothetical protein